jgi:hypothetical protein
VELLALYLNTHLEANSLTEVLAQARSQLRKGSHRPQVKQAQRRLGASETAELVAAYREGAGVNVLAARFGVHRQTVNEILRREGVALRRRGLSAEQIADAGRRYAAGWSLARLGEKFGVDGTTVWRALVAAGVPMRSPNGRSG